MKIDIDLSEVFDEDGNSVTPSFQEVIMQGVTDALVKRISRSVEDKISSELNDRIKEFIVKMLTDMTPTILDYEFQETRGYGYQPGEKISIKNKILKDIEKVMVGKDGSFDSDKSPYTKVVKSVVEEKLTAFKKEFNKEIDDRFVAEALQYATDRLKARLGIKG